MTIADETPLPRPSKARLAELERGHRSWLNGDDTAPGADDDAIELPMPPTDMDPSSVEYLEWVEAEYPEAAATVRRVYGHREAEA